MHECEQIDWHVNNYLMKNREKNTTLIGRVHNFLMARGLRD